MTSISRRSLFLGVASAAFAAAVGKVASHMPNLPLRVFGELWLDGDACLWYIYDGSEWRPIYT